MAHFAELDENNVVLRVIVIANEDITNQETGKEEEELGVSLCKRLYGEHTRWKQTSYNRNFRINYAGIGHTYDKELDAFIPKPRFKNRILNKETCQWEFPIPEPKLTEEQIKSHCWYSWDDDNCRWLLITPVP